MSPAPTVYRIEPGPGYAELSVSEVWSQSGGAPFAAGYAMIRSLVVGGQLHLLAVDAGGATTAFAVGPGDPPFKPVSSSLEIGGPWDAIEPFVLGNDPYILAYASKSGEMSFFKVAPDLSAGPPFEFLRRREPGVTVGFDMVHPAVVNSGVCILGYSSESGDVNVYTLSVIAATPPSSPAGTPPLLAVPAWVHQWARNWVHFAFFQLGGESFFFKINTGRLNVNIDHVLDQPSLGTVEVGSWLQNQLPQALDIDIVRPFNLGGGDPYFLTYMSDGSATFNRFHGDCQGWTKEAETTVVDGATEIVPFTLAGTAHALFY